jgi:hypothetical protein
MVRVANLLCGNALPHRFRVGRSGRADGEAVDQNDVTLAEDGTERDWKELPPDYEDTESEEEGEGEGEAEGEKEEEGARGRKDEPGAWIEEKEKAPSKNVSEDPSSPLW